MAERWWVDLQTLRAKNPNKYPELKSRVLRRAGVDVVDLHEGDLAWRQKMMDDHPGLTKPYEYLTTEPIVHNVTATTDRYSLPDEWEEFDPDHETALDRLFLAIGAVCGLIILGWHATKPVRSWVWARLEAVLLAVLRWFYEDSLDWLQERINNADRRSKAFGAWAKKRLQKAAWFIIDNAWYAKEWIKRQKFHHRLQDFWWFIGDRAKEWNLDRKMESTLVKAAQKAVDARSFEGLSKFFIGATLGCTAMIWFMGTVVSHWDYVPTNEAWLLISKFDSGDMTKMLLAFTMTAVALWAVNRLTVERRRRLYFLQLMKRRPVPFGRLSVIGCGLAAVIVFLPLPALIG